MPVFNVEKYLRVAIESVLQQTFKNFELIAIDDGSTDKSEELLREYAEKDSRIRILSQENSGQGPARNAGLQVARGKFLAFVDSDDFVKPRYLEVLLKTLQGSKADIACCRYEHYYERTGLTRPAAAAPKPGIYTSEKALGELISDVKFHHYMWNKLFRRRLFVDHGLWFKAMKFEDIAMCPQLFYFTKKIAVCDETLYTYRRRPCSTVSTYNASRINDYLKTFVIQRNFLQKEGIFEQYKPKFLGNLKRVKWCVFSDILQLHLHEANFSGLARNFKNANIALRYLIGGDFDKLPLHTLLPAYIRKPSAVRQKKPTYREIF